MAGSGMAVGPRLLNFLVLVHMIMALRKQRRYEPPDAAKRGHAADGGIGSLTSVRRGEMQLRRRKNTTLAMLVALGLAAAALLGPTAASADPSHNINPPVTFTCDSGQSTVVIFSISGSHEAFVVASDGSISSTSIFVIKYLAFTDESGTHVIFDTAAGLTAQGLVTCTADLDGASLTASGLFTPR
jgi:hypothetical protein